MTTSPDAVGAVGEMQQALERLTAQGLATTEKPYGFTVDGLRTISDLCILATLTGRRGGPVDQMLAETARALLLEVSAVAGAAAGQTSSEVAPMVREAEKALRQASKHAKQF